MLILGMIVLGVLAVAEAIYYVHVSNENGRQQSE